MWSNIILSNGTGNGNYEDDNDERKSPPSRYKHSGCLVPTSPSASNYDLYVYGGRSGTFPLKDFWRLDLKVGKWEELKALEGEGDSWPPHLQEHSMVHYNGNIYVFGGEISFSYGEDLAPLWIFNVDTGSWRRWGACGRDEKMKKQIKSPDMTRQAKTPLGRRGHTALVWNGYMLIYGGYRDLKGSLGDLWAFHFDTESWHLFSSPDLHKKNSRPWYLFSGGLGSSSQLPPPRHSHIAVLHNQQLFIHGGMQDLLELGDLWRFDLKKRQWINIKTKYGPGPLHGHVGVVALESLLIMSGDRGGKAIDEFWRFEFVTECWERVVVNGCRPCPRIWAWGAVLPMVVKRVEGQASPQLSTGGGSADDENKYWWDYDETLLPTNDEEEEAEKTDSNPPPPYSGTQQDKDKRRSSLFSEFTRFAYNNGDYQALSESNSVCLSEEEASPRPPQSCPKWMNSNATADSLKCQKDQSVLKVIDEGESLPQSQNSLPSISLIDLGDDDIATAHTTHFSTPVTTPNGNDTTIDTENVYPTPVSEDYDRVAHGIGVGKRPLSGGNARRSESTNCIQLQLTSSKSATGLAKKTPGGAGVKKSASVRFADMHMPSSTNSSSCLMRECTSDYSSMDNGINNGNNVSHKTPTGGTGGFENPNYHGSGSSQLFNSPPKPNFKVVEAYELEPMSPAGIVVEQRHDPQRPAKGQEAPSEERRYCYQITTPNYMLLIGGSESHSSQVVSKRQPLTIWRLRVTQDLFSGALGPEAQRRSSGPSTSGANTSNRILQMNGNTTTGF